MNKRSFACTQLNGFKSSAVRPIDILTDTTTSGQSGPESNGNKWVLHIPQNEPHNQMQFSVTR